MSQKRKTKSNDTRTDTDVVTIKHRCRHEIRDYDLEKERQEYIKRHLSKKRKKRHRSKKI